MKNISNLVLMSLVALNLSSASVFAADKQAKHESANKEEESIEYYHQEAVNAARGARPTPPKIVSPTPVSEVSGTETTLEWQKVNTADSYHLQVSENPGFFNPQVDMPLYADNKYTVTGLVKGHLYFWRVASFKKGNVTGESKSNFTLGSFKVK